MLCLNGHARLKTVPGKVQVERNDEVRLVEAEVFCALAGMTSLIMFDAVSFR